MTVPSAENQVQDNKPSDKELNFRQLESKYQKQLEQERSARIEAERIAQEALSRKQHVSHQQEEEDEDDSEPYVDHKRLNKKLAKFGEQSKKSTQEEVQKAVQVALADERRQNWLKSNPDFYDVLQHAEKFAEKDPDLAESILQMPDGFERQKLVYKNIKAFGLHKPEQKQSSVQEKIDANKRSPYYQPSGVGTAPYSQGGDYSPAGQKQAYEKMNELKRRLGLS